MADLPYITPAEADRIMRSTGDPTAGAFPAPGPGRRPSVRADEVVIEWESLTEEDVATLNSHIEAGGTVSNGPATLKSLRHSHHRVAQLVATGLDDITVAKLCNYTPQRVRDLKKDPAFAELLSHYAGEVKDAWADFVATASNLSLDVLQEMQRRLDETPETFTIGQLNEVLKTLADRSGNAPLTKTQNVNVNIGLGDRLRLARQRANAVLIEGSATVIEAGE